MLKIDISPSQKQGKVFKRHICHAMEAVHNMGKNATNTTMLMENLDAKIYSNLYISGTKILILSLFISKLQRYYIWGEKASTFLMKRYTKKIKTCWKHCTGMKWPTCLNDDYLGYLARKLLQNVLKNY